MWRWTSAYVDLFGRAAPRRPRCARGDARSPRPRAAPRARAAPARGAPRAPGPPRRCPPPRPPSCSTCCLSNAICCCSRPISSSLRVRRFARGGRRRVGLGQLEPQPLERRLELGQRARPPPSRAPARPSSRARAASIASPSSAVALRELHLLPAPQLLAQPPVAARLRRLPLQRAALLLDLEDDVVDAREVLLRRFELQLRGAAAALVLRDAGRLFDQLPPIGRAGAQNLADLALLDDGVGLDAEAGVHQQILHVAQPADLAVDQVFALARSVQPAHQLDVAHDQRPSSSTRPPAAVPPPSSSAAPVSTRHPPCDACRGRCRRSAGPRAPRRRPASAALRPRRSASARRCRRRSRPPCGRRAGSWRSARRAPTSAHRRRCSCRSRWGRRWR